MDFSSAVELLSQVHYDEVRQLRAKVEDLQSCVPATAPSTSQFDVCVEVFDPGSDFKEPAKCHTSKQALPLVMHIDKSCYNQSRQSVTEQPPGPSMRNLCPAIGDLPPCYAEPMSPNAEPTSPSIFSGSENSPWTHVRRSQTRDRWSELVLRVLSDLNSPIKLREGWQTQDMSHPSSANLRCTQDSASSSQNLTRSPSMRKSRGNDELARDLSILKRVLSSSYSLEVNRISRPSHFEAIKRNIGSTSPDNQRVFSFAIHPSSKMRLLWILCCFALLIFDLLMVTMTPFGIAESRWAKDIDIFCTVFWTLDVFLNFTSGVYVQGRAEMRFRTIAKIYLRSWFCFDALMASMQWLSIFSTTFGGAGYFTRILKPMRFVRLLRLSKISALIKSEEIASSALGPVSFNILNGVVFGGKTAKFLLVPMVFVHCSTCVWYEIGQATDGWVARHADLLQGTAFHAYLVATHWSLSQFQGSIDVYPGPSTAERAFACLSSSISIVCLALFLSSLTQLLVSLHEERTRRDHAQRTMHGFLCRHAMPPNLHARATHFMRTRQHQQAMYFKDTQDEKALQLFPARMRDEMRSELLSREFVNFGIFLYFKTIHPKVLIAVCNSAITSKMVVPEDDLFTSPEIAKFLYVVVTGELVYSTSLTGLIATSSMQFGLSMHAAERQPRVSIPSSPRETPGQSGLELQLADQLSSRRFELSRVYKGDLVSEAALWMHFLHEGHLCSSDHAQCLLLDNEPFIATVTLHVLPYATLQRYARHYYDAVVTLRSRPDFRIELIPTRDILQHNGMQL